MRQTALLSARARLGAESCLRSDVFFWFLGGVDSCHSGKAQPADGQVAEPDAAKAGARDVERQTQGILGSGLI